MVLKLSAILVSSLLYAVVRYIVCGPVDPIHMPVYILNKATSVSSVVFLLLTALHYRRSPAKKNRFWGMAMVHSAFVHIVMSLSILSEAYYPKFFESGKMNLDGELTMMAGALAAYCIWRIRSAGSDFMRRKLLQIFATLFIIVHLVAMGYRGWLTPGKWHGGLPPISLVGFVVAVAAVALFLQAKEKSTD